MAAVIQPTVNTIASTATARATVSTSSLTQNSFHFPSTWTKTPPQFPPLSLLSLSLFKPNPPRHRHRRQPHFSTSTTQSLVPSHSFPLYHLDGFASRPAVAEAPVDIDDLLYLLRLSVKFADFGVARAAHASILKLEEDTYLGTAVITAYLKLGLLRDAYEVFQGLSSPDVVSHTALISGFAKANKGTEAIQLFFRMRSSDIEPNEYSFVAILSACIRTLDLELGFQVHALAVKMGFLECVFVANALMGLYGKCECLDCAIQLFDDMPQRDIASWNTIISCFVKESLYERALEFFRYLQESRIKADDFTLSSLLTACAGIQAVIAGREVHAHAVRIGLEANLSVSNAIIGFYIRCGSLKDVKSVYERMVVRDIVTWTEMITAYVEFGLVDLAVEMFEKMPERNSVSYNALLAGFFQNGEGLKALDLFIKMLQEGIEMTDFTLTSVVSASGLLCALESSRQIHGFVIKVGFGSNACIEAALIDMYTRCGRMNDAKKMFCIWPSDKDSSVVQTSMLCGYARNGLPEEAISLFLHSQSEGKMVLDEVALSSVIGVCGTLGFLEMGKQIHCRALKEGFLVDLGVGNSIISMHSKCHNMDDAIVSFNSMSAHDIVSWNALITGHLLHRQGDEARALWFRMENAGVKPDTITFTSIISSYKHTTSNLVNECRSLFLSMKPVYNIEPTSEHYASLVSVLGSWGLLKEAEQLIIEMPFEPEAFVWRALLDSCRLHLDSTIGKRVAKRILAMEPQDLSTFILVSNLYSASGRWNCSEMVRENMKDRGLEKYPCRSWIIHQKKVHSFYVRDKSHPQTKNIYSGLDILILECLKVGYEPDTSFVLHEVGEHQKKDFLFYHSAKLAATHGLLTTRPGEPIRVVKNVLLCGDCHSFLKYVSIVTGKEIFLRDTSGFHCFSNGQCSCNDYW